MALAAFICAAVVVGSAVLGVAFGVVYLSRSTGRGPMS